MIFKSPEELVEFFNKLDLDKSTLVFKTDEEEVVEEQKDCACGGSGTCQCPTEEVTESVKIEGTPDTVLIESMSDSPSVPVQISESDENIFYVSDYESIPDACGTGMVQLPDRQSFMNMCEMDGAATVHLDLVVEGQILKNIKLTLAKTEADPYIVLNKNHISS